MLAALQCAADAKYFHIDYTSGISSNANVTGCVCACLKCIIERTKTCKRFETVGCNAYSVRLTVQVFWKLLGAQSFFFSKK